MRFPEVIRAPGVLLVGKHCFSELAENFHLGNTECLKHALSKGLGFGIVLGGAIVKLPQIYKIVSSGSVEGLNLLSVILESLSMIIFVSYNHRGQFPFSTYGESFFLTIQNFIILLLLFVYRGQPARATLGSAVFLTMLYALNDPSWVGPAALATFQAATIPISLMSRVPQILTNFRNGHTGQLAAFTVLNSFLGCVVRVFTTLHEVNDSLILLGFVLASLLNGVLAFQMVYYWNAKSGDRKSYGFDQLHKKSK
ncbi:hypothetical protein BJ085DRAFT_14536 [Dimargaris cristalligena]|uniref:Mannose-P-dolichol utilization defect 1 protein homolog n=1 Tax=Dimargaris cristalligena TaxID=215637 RepID=A0A4P9ZNC2_9FUNG|nr:hypothetical protein BJ085DRAFT_14536 [Dimargaris cristalligena]|eukprot:RKP34665.1 hypothetical protein BJ085DRAFT_14536 [Dimargaris cristalligena]